MLSAAAIAILRMAETGDDGERGEDAPDAVKYIGFSCYDYDVG